MNPRWRQTLFDPLNIAAYIAWAVIAFSLWKSGVQNSSGLVAPQLFATIAYPLHALFLLCFIAYQMVAPETSRRLLLVLLQLAIGLALTAMVRYSVTPVLMVIATAQLVPLCRLPWLLLILGTANAGVYAIAAYVWGARAPVAFTLSYLSFQLFAGMMTWYAFKAERGSEELARLNADLLATRSLLAESVRDSERLRLSRELHDIAGHKLTALKLNLAALAREPALAQHEPVAMCAQLADELLADIRGVVQQMRLHDGVDLRSALQSLATPFPRPRAHFELAESARLADVEQAEAVLRTVQEALTNAARHGNADNIWIVLQREPGLIRLRIHDDGRGGGALQFGNGLSGMRERIEAAGGELHVDHHPRGGVQLSATLPVPA